MFLYREGKIVFEENTANKSIGRLSPNDLKIFEKHLYMSKNIFARMRSLGDQEAKEILEAYCSKGVLKCFRIYFDDGLNSSRIYTTAENNEIYLEDVLISLSTSQAICSMGVSSYEMKDLGHAIINDSIELVSIRSNFQLDFVQESSKKLIYVIETEELAARLYRESGYSFNFITDSMTAEPLESYLHFSNEEYFVERPL